MKGGKVKGDAFEPRPSSAADRARDGYLPPGQDVSINWEDDEGALRNLRTNRTNAAHGVVRIHTRQLIDTLAIAQPKLADRLELERRAIPGNAYHGNIVFCEGLNEHEIDVLCSYLGLAAQFVPQDDAA